MKKRHKLLLGFLIAVVISSASIVILVKTDFFKEYVVKQLASRGASYAGIDLKVNDFSINFFPPQVQINGLQFIDKKENSYSIYINNLLLEFSVFKIFVGKVDIGLLKVESVTINLKSSEKTQDEFDIKSKINTLTKFKIEKINISNLSFSYTDEKNKIYAKGIVPHIVGRLAFDNQASTGDPILLRDGKVKVYKDNIECPPLLIEKLLITMSNKYISIDSLDYKTGNDEHKLKGKYILKSGIFSFFTKGKIDLDQYKKCLKFNSGFSGKIKYVSNYVLGSKKRGKVYGKSNLLLSKVNLDGFLINDANFEIFNREHVFKLSGIFNTKKKGELHIDSSIDISNKDLNFSGKLNSKNVFLSEILKSVKASTKRIDILINGSAQFTGRLNEFSLSGKTDLDCSNIRINGSTELVNITNAKLQTSLNINKNRLDITEGLISYKGNKINAKALFDFTDSMDISYNAEKINLPQGLVFSKQLKGFAEKIEGRVWGKYSNLQIATSFNLSKLKYDKFNINNLYGSFALKDSKISIKDLSVKAYNSSAQIDIKSDFSSDDFAAEANIYVRKFNPQDLLKIYPNLKADYLPSGFLSGSGVFEIKNGSKSGHLNLRGRSLDFNENSFQSPTISLKYENDKLIIDHFSCEEGQMVASGFVSPEETDLKLTIADLPIKKMINDESFKLDSKLTGTLSINYKDKLKSQGNLILGETNYDGQALADSQIDFNMEDNVVSVNAKLLEKIEVTSNIDIDKQYLNLRYDTRNLDLGFLFKSLSMIGNGSTPTLLLDSKGVIKSKTNDIKNLNADIDISRVNFTFKGNSISNTGPINILASNGKYKISPWEAKINEKLIKIFAKGDFNKNIDFKLEGFLPLNPLTALVPAISGIDADIEFALNIRGEIDNPILHGKGKIIGSYFSIGNLKQPFVDPFIEFNFNQDKMVFDKITCTLGDGNISGQGYLAFRGFVPDSVYTNFSLNDISFEILPQVSMILNGDLAFNGPLSSPDISGNINIKEAKYLRKVNWKTDLLNTLNFIKKKKKPKGLSTSDDSKLNLNLVIISEDSILIDNNVARSQLGGNLKISGSLDKPSVIGQIKTEKGKVFFREHEFEIIIGALKFSDPTSINPMFEVIAQTEVMEKVEKIPYRIYFNAGGNLQNFSTTFTSEPYLDDYDILSLIEVGVTAKSIESAEVGKWEAASVLTGSAQEFIENELTSKVKFIKTFQIVPSYSDVSDSVQPFLLISTKISDDIEATYKAALENIGEQAADVEYKMIKTFSLLADWKDRGINKTSEMGVGFKFKWEFK
ncbi:MAG: translocation/assembly module TamB domain-containing protein [Pseudomonadota bacterium]